jgi:hypothetical protein
MSVLTYAHPQLFEVFQHLIYVSHGCGMQFERFYSHNDSVVGSFPHLQLYDFSQLSQIWRYVCGGNGMSVLPYAHPQLFKAFQHLIYVWHGCGMQFERFYRLNDSVVGSFPHLHHLWFQRTFPNLGKPLQCNGVSVLPYAHPQLFKHLIYVWHGCGMQFERFYRLNDSVVGLCPHLHHLWISKISQIWGNLCCCNGMNVLPYAHPQLFKVFKHLIYVSHGRGCSLKGFTASIIA